MNSAAYPQLPPFLQLSRSDILHKSSDLQWAEHIRLAEGLRATQQKPSKYSRLSTSTFTDRNRYGNIDPYSSNRVRLRVAEDIDDYINASPISLKRTKTGRTRTWIATQGPKHPTAAHLYRMIFDETGPPEVPATVVMLTQTHEAGREKCFQYYPLAMDDPLMELPNTGSHSDGWLGHVELLSLDRIDELRSERRTLKLTVSSSHEWEKSKIINHYLYKAWPDFGVPEAADRLALIDLIKATRRTTPASSGTRPRSRESHHETETPRIIHCSAGVGRSGTFIALDHLLTELDDGSFDGKMTSEADPIYETVDTMRQQRMMMVQGEVQFLLLYEIVRTLWLARHGLGPAIG